MFTKTRTWVSILNFWFYLSATGIGLGYILPVKLAAQIRSSETFPTQPDASNPTIRVTEFEFSGNTVFSDAELAEALVAFTNIPLTFEQLLQAETKLTALYTEAGYLNSGAIIPAEQTFEQNNARIKIEIIEGTVAEVRINGLQRLNNSYVRDRIERYTRSPLNQTRLLEGLQLLQLDPRIDNIQAELREGPRPDRAQLSLTVTEASTFHLDIFTNNGRNPSVGTWRRGATLSEDNLTGNGDRLSLTYTNTDGSNAFDGLYSFPLNSLGSELIFTGGVLGTEVVEEPFEILDITGDSFYAEATFKQSLLRSPTQELTLGLTFSRESSQTAIFGFNVPLSPGANDNGQTDVSVFRFFQEWTQRSRFDVFTVRSEFNLGTGILGATVNSDPPDSRFLAWRSQGQYVRQLAPAMLLVARSDLQLSSRALPPLEQFSLGGFQSVRGYRQDARLTDNGFLGSVEIRLPVWKSADLSNTLQIIPFIDGGLGWSSSGFPNPDPNGLVGVGLGLQWQMVDRLRARFDWGIPLIELEDQNRTLQEQGLYFSLDYRLF